MVDIRYQPGSIVLVNNSEVIVLADLGIHQEDAGRAYEIQPDLRAVRAVGCVLPYRVLGAAGYVEGQARGDRSRQQAEPQHPEGTWKMSRFNHC